MTLADSKQGTLVFLMEPRTGGYRWNFGLGEPRERLHCNGSQRNALAFWSRLLW